jgi:hypothetical protein
VIIWAKALGAKKTLCYTFYTINFFGKILNMNTLIKNALTSSVFLKTTSLILGFLFWTILSDSFTQSIWLTVPLCFYNCSTLKIQAPETIRIELKGKRAFLKQLPTQELAVHIDGKDFKPGTTKIEITPEMLLLPHSVIVGEVVPSACMVTVTQGDTL